MIFLMFQSNTRIVIVVMGHLVVWATYLLTSPRCAPNLCHCPTTVRHHHRPPHPHPHPHLWCAPNLCHCSAVHHHHGYTVPAIIIAISFIMMSTTIKIIIIIITVVVILLYLHQACDPLFCSATKAWVVGVVLAEQDLLSKDRCEQNACVIQSTWMKICLSVKSRSVQDW